MYEVIPNRMKKMISVILSILIVVSMTVFTSNSVFVYANGFDLQAAIDEADNGDTIKLQEDVNQDIKVLSGQEITVDLNGYTISSSDIAIVNDGVLTIKGNGMVVGSNQAIVNNGQLFLQGGTYSNSVDGKAVIHNGNELVIENSYIYGANGVFQEQGIITINNGSRLVCNSVSNNNYCLFVRSGDVEINGGYFEGKYNIYSNNLIASGTGYRQFKGYGIRITVNDGEFHATDSNFYSPFNGIYDNGNYSNYENYLIINGGAFESSYYSIYHDYSEARNYRIEINDGQFVCNGFIYDRGTDSRIIINGGIEDNLGSVFITQVYYGGRADTVITSMTQLSEFDTAVLEKSHISGAVISLENPLGEKVWYMGTAANRAIRNAQSGSIITVIAGALSATNSHDVTLTVDQGASAIINGNVVPSDGMVHQVHAVTVINDMSPCASSQFTCLYYCSDCEKYYSDINCTNEVNPTYNHQLTRVPKKAPTTTSDGYEEYYVCGVCGEMFSDAHGNNPISAPIVIPKLPPTTMPTAKPTSSPTVKPTVKPTGNPTTAPSNKPTAKPTSAPVKPTSVPSTVPTVKPTTAPTDTTETGVAGFVERLYSVALNRVSDPNGKADWISRITSGSTSGAEAARGFFMSQEFINSNHSDEEFLNRLYRTFFNREPDQAGFNNWLAQLKGGASRESVLAGFVNSTEWANLCLTYGIVSGGTGKPNIVIQPNEQVVGFATRLYTTCLGREPDAGGLTNWSMQLANMQISGSETAHGFFFSLEFLEHNYSNEEYVTRLYRTFMNREPDPAGFADWTGRLANGATRESVFHGFAGSAEWAKICSDYGILK